MNGTNTRSAQKGTHGITKQMTNDARSIGPLVSHGQGSVAGNPRLCLKCGKPIRNGEAWTKHTSAAEPGLGAYSIILHARCESKR